MIRHTVKSAATAATVALVLAACAPGQSANEDDVSEPLKVGFLTPLTGPAAGAGADFRDGFQLYLDQNDDELGGREVALTVEDDQGDPEAGIQAARRLVERKGAQLVVGPVVGSVGLSVGEYMDRTEVPLFYPIPASDAFLRDKPENMTLAGGTAAQGTHPAGQFAADQGYRRVLTICSDYAFGHELCGGFANTFGDAGGDVVKQLWPPLGTSDFGPYLAQMADGNYDAIFNGVVAADAVRFVEAYRSFGLDDVPLLSSMQSMDESQVAAMGDSANGLLSTGHWVEGRDDEAVSDFVAAYEEAFDKVPGYYSASGYFAGQWLNEALGDSDGQVGSLEDFQDAVRNADLSATVFGAIDLDDEGNVIWPISVRTVEQRDDGTYWNVVEEDLEPVGPAWTYDYAEYLEQPAYSRSYQGEGWPEQ